jgi:glucose/mannose transport system substrate-binding protein
MQAHLANKKDHCFILFWKRAAPVVLIFAWAFILAACSAAPFDSFFRPTPSLTPFPTPVPTPTPLPRLEIYHWWTAESDRPAAGIMLDAFRRQLPAVQITENPLQSGETSPFQALQARLENGQPPDTFQLGSGAELKAYFDHGALQPVDLFYQESGYKDVLPPPVYHAVSIAGRPYAVPLTIHVQNLLYYNRALFAELGLQAPESYADLLAAAEMIGTARPEMIPFAVAGGEKWASALLLDSLLLEEGGAAYVMQFYKGEVDIANDPVFRRALEKLAALIPYSAAQSTALTWEESVLSLTSGEAAMLLMGSWALGEFSAHGWNPGEQLAAVVFPQQPERILLFHADTFGLPPAAPHPATASVWLAALASVGLQQPTVAAQRGLFARTDIDPALLPDPLRQELQTILARHPGSLLPGQFGSPAPTPFIQAYWETIAGLTSASDIDATIARVADLFSTYQVKDSAAWYQWP